ncbi:redox-sensing transcriptional repressor Rex [Pelotomaculum terephthalicicum JT]|uniref:redox-sensing transcriptional repressor Rex n=1 Tax=Pelotomaculum TaxID=191373 RepID=UPI0009CD0527|nr:MULTISPECIES: redox-sensing transcriptional repressor Rex [Pelotomaculum]MCG9966480.1 redox-sensing transcriptional repressor Rex [Pelotomaculum terephthalicicum JT]OPX85977.1 MAG: Redox-sensing transcriptional repressor Rex [Pelotomaculum sp. PtaB.Bin117]OPY63379.1 MAG: Redox-sensing transcriptional repressor Rex [Pelotomaculum sp. PtaU1.Bin065]
MKTLRVPEATITRLSVYSRFLEYLDRRGIVTVSSREIAQGVGVGPAQVRKDLAYFGEFGTRGVGYNVKDLMRYTLKILGLDEPWPLVLVGAGNLGFALCTYKGFNERGFSIIGVFDNDPNKIGKKIVDLEVYHLDKMAEVIARHNVKVGIIAVPSQAAQEVTDLMVKNGLLAILNYAPVALNVPENIEMRNVDMATKLEILTCNLSKKDFNQAT